MKKSLSIGLIAIVALANLALAQTVNIKFRYQPQRTYTRIHFPGEFNNWGNNSSGAISAGDASQADSMEAATGLWVKTIPISFGTHEYKIYQQLSPAPSDWNWIPDPLNRVEIGPYQNSQLVVDSLVLLEVCAYPYTIETGTSGTTFVLKTGIPNLSAGIFRPAGSPPLTVTAFVDGTPISNAINYYDASSGIFTYKPSAVVSDGIHTFIIVAGAGNQSRSDSVQFEIRARPVQIQTPPFTTHKSVYVTAGFILKPDGSGIDTSVTSASFSLNGIVKTVSVTNGNFLDSTALSEGPNRIKVSTTNGADSVLVTRIVNHSPNAQATAQLSGSSVQLSAANSTDPDAQTLTNFKWFDDPAYPLGLVGKTGTTVTVTKPSSIGEYYFGLVATDPDGNVDTTRSYFVIKSDGALENPTIASNPEWAKRARVYFLFPKAFSQSGTIAAASQRLQYIKDLGFNVIWMMPVMKNAFKIDQQYGPGYNITDFYNVAPEYGTNQDFKDFVTQAHSLGIKVILDVTPNHTSRFHPWSADAHSNLLKSPYWNWYEHTKIPHNENGLGQSLDGDGFDYYSGFSDQLLNFNWRDIDAQSEMINVYKTWIRDFGVDGYRFDVYWGPHRRYGDQYMGKPVRDALKHIKPDILLLAEDDGTGTGTESIYADYSSGEINGGVDAGYDFKLYFNQIRNFGFSDAAVNNLHGDVNNGGYYPGPNALYMRFLESQDEDRIAYFYSQNQTLDATTTFKRTMPMGSVIFTVPGFPMLWNGQEVGWGFGISGAKEARNRSTIDWDFQGKTFLSPHYQRLAWIRGTYQAFVTQTITRLSTGNGLVYGFTRPFSNANGVALMNFSSSTATATVTLSDAGTPNVFFTGGIQNGKTYYMNDVYNDTSFTIIFSSGSANYSVTLPAYGSAVYILSDSLISLKVPSLTGVGKKLVQGVIPTEFALRQNYPNPFNPATHIQFAVPERRQTSAQIVDQQFATLKVYDVLGREVATLINEKLSPGIYNVEWNAAPYSTGVYFYTLRAGSFVATKKMLLVR
jgi:glycosidase